MDERDHTIQRGEGDEEVARLVKLGGLRPAPPDERLERLRGAAHGLLARCALHGHQPMLQRPRRLVHFIDQLSFQPCIAPLRAQVTADLGGQAGGQQLSQPANERGLRVPPELCDIAVRLQECLLHEIDRVHLALQAPHVCSFAHRVGKS